MASRCPTPVRRPPACRRPSLPASHSPRPRGWRRAPAHRPRRKASSAHHAAAHPACGRAPPRRAARRAPPGPCARPLAGDQQGASGKLPPRRRSRDDAPFSRQMPNRKDTGPDRPSFRPQRRAICRRREGGEIDTVAQPVTFPAAAPRAFSPAARPALTAISASARAMRRDQPARSAKRGQLLVSEPTRGNHHCQPGLAGKPHRGVRRRVEIMRIDGIETAPLGKQLRERGAAGPQQRQGPVYMPRRGGAAYRGCKMRSPCRISSTGAAGAAPHSPNPRIARGEPGTGATTVLVAAPLATKWRSRFSTKMP